MKKILLVLLIFSLLFHSVVALSESEVIPAGQFPETGFSGIGDTDLLRYMEDAVYDELVATLNSDQFFVENVSAIYISQEYLEELEYNSKENIYFGYKLSDIANCFQGTKYVFTLGDNGKTIVTEFEEYDDTYEQVLRNVAIGTGVILICVTVSVVTYGAGAYAVSAIFAASAKTGTAMALSSGLIGGVSAGIVTGVQTGDMEEALKAAALAGSENYKWGAISGAISGGASKAIALKGATMSGLSMNEAAIIQKESGYPIEIIKRFKNMEQYEACKKMGIYTKKVNGRKALVRDIDLDFLDEAGRSNLLRMQKGMPPLDPVTGKAYELHHLGQEIDSPLAILTQQEHRLGDNYALWHDLGASSDVHKNPAQWNKEVKAFWRQFAASL